MKEKLYNPARNNEQAPEKGMASVNTHTEEEAPMPEVNERPLLENEDEEVTQKDTKESLH